VNTTFVQDMNEKFDQLHKNTITSGDGVISLTNKYETLENRMNTFESKYIVLLFDNFLLINNILSNSIMFIIRLIIISLDYLDNFVQ